MKSVLIIGCGLLGSSLLRRIHKKKLANKIFVYETSKRNIKKIKRLKLPGILIQKPEDVASQSELIIFCTPMSEYKKIILKMNKNLHREHIITDIGSSKLKSLEIVNKNLRKGIFWNSSHPIAGSEVSGPKFGNKDLFKNKWCILINKGEKKKIKSVKKFWQKLGSKIILMNVNEHDKIFAITSHLPHLIAYNLIKTAQDFQKIEKRNVIKYSAGGLRDFSRTAASNEVMWRDIFFSNKDNMINSINKFIQNLNLIKSSIKYKKDRELKKILINSKKVRKQIIDSKQDVSKPDFGRNI